MGNDDQKIQNTAGLEPVSQLLGSLKRVEAPNDFDFRVRARIASGRPAEGAKSWIPASVRFAVPLVLLLSVGGYVAFNTVYTPDNIDVPAVAGVESVNVAPVIEPPSNARVSVPSEQIVAERVETRPLEIANKNPVKEPEKSVSKPDPKLDRPGGGSLVQAQGNSVKILPTASNRTVQLSPKDYLSSVGVNASFNGSGWIVQSVSGAAGGAGVKAGDVIEVVNVQSGGLRIRRDGKIIQISVK